MNNYLRDLSKDIKSLLSLSFPLVAALLAQVGMETVDTLMMGRLGVKQLAAGALGGAIFLTLLIFGIGLMSAVGVLIARRRGAKEYRGISRSLWNGVYLSFMFSIFAMVIIFWANHLLLVIGQELDIVSLTTAFLRAIVWGFPAALVFIVLREFVAALSKPRIVMFISVAAIPLNAALNYILMYGLFGLPTLGITGIGLASSIVEWLMVASLIWYVFKQKQLKLYLLARGTQQLNLSYLSEIVKLGWPVSLLMGFEVGLFSITTTLMGYFGEDALAAHQIALQCATIAFVIPLGIAQATAISVGHACGANNPFAARRASYMGLSFGLIIAAFTALLFVLAPRFLTNLFVDARSEEYTQVVSLAIHFFWVAALFQFGDAVQVISNGALRGYKDTFIPMLLGLLSYWMIGLFSGYSLAFWLGFAGVGLWWGLAIGIAASSTLLFLRLRRHFSKFKNRA